MYQKRQFEASECLTPELHMYRDDFNDSGGNQGCISEKSEQKFQLMPTARETEFGVESYKVRKYS